MRRSPTGPGWAVVAHLLGRRHIPGRRVAEAMGGPFGLPISTGAASTMFPMGEPPAKRPSYKVIEKRGKQPPKAPPPPKSQPKPPKPPPSGKNKG